MRAEKIFSRVIKIVLLLGLGVIFTGYSIWQIFHFRAYSDWTDTASDVLRIAWLLVLGAGGLWAGWSALRGTDDQYPVH
ncbi:MAG TPA: hypothetical protein VJ835_04920 [Fimbriimonadaceae bacterium]|nr:hypothetical protein [Fimbriimonadaceae bacterium]